MTRGVPRQRAPKVSGLAFYALALSIALISFGIIPFFTLRLHERADIGAACALILLGAAAGWLLVLIGLGLEVCGVWLGVLASGRNAYSLSRLQMTLWTWLILSALTAAAVCRSWGLGGGDATSALGIQINGDLFAALGVSFFTGAATPALLALKSQSATAPEYQAVVSSRMGQAMTVRGQVVYRPPQMSPSLGDIVRGDDVGSAGIIDLSKVQQLIITLVLVGVYAAALYGFFAHGVLGVVTKDNPRGLTILPAFSDDLVKLLVLSHAGYLGYKAAPKPPPSDDAGAAFEGPPPTPERKATLP